MRQHAVCRCKRLALHTMCKTSQSALSGANGVCKCGANSAREDHAQGSRRAPVLREHTNNMLKRLARAWTTPGRPRVTKMRWAREIASSFVPDHSGPFLTSQPYIGSTGTPSPIWLCDPRGAPPTPIAHRSATMSRRHGSKPGPPESRTCHTNPSVVAPLYEVMRSGVWPNKHVLAPALLRTRPLKGFQCESKKPAKASQHRAPLAWQLYLTNGSGILEESSWTSTLKSVPVRNEFSKKNGTLAY